MLFTISFIQTFKNSFIFIEKQLEQLRAGLVQALQNKAEVDMEKAINAFENLLPPDKLPEQDKSLVDKAREIIQKLKSKGSMIN